MTIVRPFRSVRYNLEKVLLKKVIAPPYDVINEAYRDELSKRSPNNVTLIDLPVGENKYNVAAEIYQNWRTNNILIKDPQPAFYVYEQEYDYNGEHYIRTGFVGLLKIEQLGKGVYPHEKTLAGPKQDRFDLMSSCKANFSQIFGLYMDSDNKMQSIFEDCHRKMPVESATDDADIKHSIWMVTDQKKIEEIQTMMKDKAVYIADGHHRYETAIAYRDKMRAENNDDPTEIKPYDFVMMMFVNAYDPGLMIFPTHRVVDVPADFNAGSFIENLKNEFTVEPVGDGAEDLFLEANASKKGAMIVVMSGGKYGIAVRDDMTDKLHPVYKDVDTYILEKNILNTLLNISEEQILAKKGIYFYQTMQEIMDNIAKGGKVGFYLKGMSADVVRKVSENGLVMPQKSTFFYPKLATGLLFNEI